MRLLLLCACFTLALSHSCKDTLNNAGISSRFNETIAHAIHSMTVEGLKLFEPFASEKNSIPTVNQDLSKPEKVLPFAPDVQTGSSFATPVMNTIDKILSSIGDAKDGLGPHWSSIERVAHVFHMWDLWFKIRDSAWGDVTKNPPKDTTCQCLTDIENNGIKAAVGWVAKHYEKGTPITLLNRPIPKLLDAKSWSVWKDRLLHYYTPEALKDAATYLYCALY
ncbi:hypothetical protein FSP39_024502 [Pinctada imbricata]|uniref:Uncharacterized protein n=1 Tax=Pinctada imbricata TaxID=66713 RepID=A0AA88YM60_PINIB|nr:hypothetical protein FSP39_024502 [Pinctada imbricata]